MEKAYRMSVLLKKILWFRVDDIATPINITDSVNMNVGRGLDIKNNMVDVNLLNPAIDQTTESVLQYRYVDDNGVIQFQENDQIKVYLRYTDDPADVEDAVWGEDPNQEPSSAYLKGTYFVIDKETIHDLNKTSIKIKCADKAFILLNRLLAKAFLNSDGLTSPTAIQKLIRFASEGVGKTYPGTEADVGVTYDIQANLVSKGGFIQDTRRATKEDGTVNSDTTFPTVAVSKVWKPIYEWIGELSQIDYVNTAAELSSTLVYGRPFIFWIDEDNKFHWVETNDTLTTADNIIVGTTEHIISHKLKKSVFDTINFIVFRGGEDLLGKGTLDYDVDETTPAKNIKMRVVPMTDIARTLIQEEIALGHLVANAAGAFWFSGNNYDASGYPLTPGWTSTAVNNDTAYNDSLIKRVFELGHLRARNIISGVKGGRWKGPVGRKGTQVTVGNLLEFTDLSVGINTEKIRIMDFRDNINKNGWFTTLQLEQDQLAIEKGAVT